MSSKPTKPSTEIAKAAPKAEVVAYDPSLTSSWGPTGADAADVLIPRLLVMQPLSELVTEGKAKAGEIVRSTTKEILGGNGKAVHLIPLFIKKDWGITEKTKNSNKFEFRRRDPWTAHSESAEWEWQEGGSIWQRNKTINLYALLPGDVDAEAAAYKAVEESGESPDLNKALVPVVLQFTRTSYMAGREVVTKFAQADSFRRPAAATVLGYDTKLIKNEKGTFYVSEISEQGKTLMPHLVKARYWYDIVSRGIGVKVDEEPLDVTPSERF